MGKALIQKDERSAMGKHLREMGKAFIKLVASIRKYLSKCGEGTKAIVKVLKIVIFGIIARNAITVLASMGIGLLVRLIVSVTKAFFGQDFVKQAVVEFRSSTQQFIRGECSDSCKEKMVGSSYRIVGAVLNVLSEFGPSKILRSIADVGTVSAAACTLKHTKYVKHQTGEMSYDPVASMNFLDARNGEDVNFGEAPQCFENQEETNLLETFQTLSEHSTLKGAHGHTGIEY